MLKNYIRKVINSKNFCTLINQNKDQGLKIPFLNNYLTESLFTFSKKSLKEPQLNIIESINKFKNTIIMCDDFSGRKYSCMLGIMNKLLNRKDEGLEEKEKLDLIQSEDFFVNTVNDFKRKKENIHLNNEKKEINPRGALVICQKFEFATHFYRICRRLDYKNKLKLIRVGTSLHTVAPTVELDVA
jgi:hypothetical protein